MLQRVHDKRRYVYFDARKGFEIHGSTFHTMYFSFWFEELLLSGQIFLPD